MYFGLMSLQQLVPELQEEVKETSVCRLLEYYVLKSSNHVCKLREKVPSCEHFKLLLL